MSGSDELTHPTNEDKPLLGFSVESNLSLRELQADRPVIGVLTPAGDDAWLVTRHAEIRKLAVDRRIGRTHPDPYNAPRYLHNPMLDLWRSSDFDSEHEAHGALRTMLAPFFSGRNIGLLEPQVARKVDEAVTRFSARTPPVDVYSQFSLPLTAQVLGELIGVPAADCDTFAALVCQLSDVIDMQPLAGGADDAVLGYLRGLVARKHAAPGDDVLSGLVAAGNTDEQCAGISFILIRAGFISPSKNTMNAIAKIAGDPVLRDRLAADPALMKSAVEEFLRTATTESFLFPHYAREDIEIAGVTIRAGDLVLLDYARGNYDERAFPAPGELDITRSPNPHLSFSHGMWHCIGAPLARMQLTMSFNALLAALPTLRLAKPLDEMAHMPGNQGDRTELLVTW